MPTEYRFSRPLENITPEIDISYGGSTRCPALKGGQIKHFRNES
jgi:hypothetical protein